MDWTMTGTSWKVWWGSHPLPEGAVVKGTIRRGDGREGALIQMRTGEYVQGNAGTLSALPQWRVRKLLEVREEEIEREIAQAEQAIEDGQARWAATGSSRM